MLANSVEGKHPEDPLTFTFKCKEPLNGSRF